MGRLKVGIDLDGTIANFIRSFNTIYNERVEQTGDKQINSNYEPRDYYEMWSGKGNYKKEISDYIWKYHKSEIFYEMGLYKDAIKFLDHVLDIGYQIVFITSRDDDVRRISKMWYQDVGLVGYGILIFEDPLAKHKHCDIVIDDREDTIQKTIEAGKKGFLVGRPWNASSKLPKMIYNEILRELEGTNPWKKLPKPKSH